MKFSTDFLLLRPHGMSAFFKIAAESRSAWIKFQVSFSRLYIPQNPGNAQTSDPPEQYAPNGHGLQVLRGTSPHRFVV